MIHYLTLGTNDLSRARAFYDPVLASLGITCLHVGETEVCYGAGGASMPLLYIIHPYDERAASHGNGTMLALHAATPDHVAAFHTIALAHGGSDQGAPGLRYSSTFFACYVRDPDGNKLSAVSDRPENAHLP